MYPNLSKLLFSESHSSVEEKEKVADNEFVGYPELDVSLPDLRQMLSQNLNFYDARQYKLLKKFLDEEQEYVDKLAVLEVQKFDLASIKVPVYDLQNLFGYVEEIKTLHESVLPRSLIHLGSIEDVLNAFVMHKSRFRIYVEDQWQKSQVKFSGKKALLKRFYNKDIINDLSLPEQKISDYLKLHEHIKSTCEYLKTSDIFQQSFQLVNNIYIQMQYVKQAAAVDKFSISIFQNIRLVNTFYITVDNTLPIQYKVFLMDDSIVFTTVVNQNQVGKVEMHIKNDAISLNATTRDELTFEMYLHSDKNHKKVYLFVANNTQVRNEWMQTLKEILYKQMVVERQRVKSSSDGSPIIEVKHFP